MKKLLIKPRMLSIFLFAWIILAVFRVIYNDIKLVTFDKNLFFLSRTEREKEVYGDVSILYHEIPKITHGEPLLLTGNDGGMYFFLRYLLYPQKVYWVNNISLADTKMMPWKYVFRPLTGRMIPKEQGKREYVIVDSTSGKKLGTIIAL